MSLKACFVCEQCEILRFSVLCPMHRAHGQEGECEHGACVCRELGDWWTVLLLMLTLSGRVHTARGKAVFTMEEEGERVRYDITKQNWGWQITIHIIRNPNTRWKCIHLFIWYHACPQVTGKLEPSPEDSGWEVGVHPGLVVGRRAKTMILYGQFQFFTEPNMHIFKIWV